MPNLAKLASLAVGASQVPGCRRPSALKLAWRLTFTLDSAMVADAADVAVALWDTEMPIANEHEGLRRRLNQALLLIVGMLSVGTAGYKVIEGWSWFDSFYMTVITLATIGFGETHELGTPGRVFTILLILTGVGTLTYTLGVITEFFAVGGWEAYRRRARMDAVLKNIREHTIICGYGRLGNSITHVLVQQRARVVVVEKGADEVRRLRELGIPHVQGDANDDEVLREAGIDRAQTLVAALNNDAANVFLTLTAKVLNPLVMVYGKADDPATLVKLERAGANEGFSPSTVAGHRIAWQILRPAVTDLIGIATDRGRTELAIEEVAARDVPNMVGKTLSKSGLWGVKDVMILAIATHDRGLVFPPHADHLLADGDRLVVIGKDEALTQAGIARGVRIHSGRTM